MKRVTAGMVAILLVVTMVSAANHYVRPGATGNGSDWNDALGALPDRLTRGDTYYLADGKYGNYEFNDKESGTLFIYLKKAVASDHGTGTGWKAEYGDGVAEFTSGIRIKNGYYDFDGQTGGGPGSWDKGFGLKFHNTNAGAVNMNGFAGKDANGNAIIHNIKSLRFRHFDCTTTTGPVGDGSYYGGTCFSMTQAAGEDWQWQYGYLHDIRGLMWQLNYQVDGFTIEYCYAARNIAYDYKPGASAHIEAYKGNASLNGIFRYSIFEDIRGTGFLVIFNNNYQIHGNVFRWTAGFDGSVGNGVIT